MSFLTLGRDDLFGNEYDRKESYTTPVNVGDDFDVKIEFLGRNGDRIARVEGFVVFVPGAGVGDEVKIKVNAVRQKFAFAEIIE